MKKKILALVLASLMVLALFAGCNNTKAPAGDDVDAPTGGDAKPTVMFCISHMTNAWAKEAAESMQAAADAAGVDLIVNEASQDINKQVGQVESGINQKVDAIIIEPVSTDGIVPAVEEAMAADIPVIIFNQNISDPSKASCFVGVSNEEFGYVEMKRAIEDIGGKGNVAVLLGPLGSEGQINRSKGYERALAEYPDVKIVFEEPADWTTEKGLSLAENWLQTGTEINAFVCQNDNMALGAVKALEDKGMADQVKCYGLDAVPDALQAVKDGRLAITVSQETPNQSKAAIDAALKLIKGENVDAEILVDIALVDSSNVDSYLG